jgi:hypothetical protein
MKLKTVKTKIFILMAITAPVSTAACTGNLQNLMQNQGMKTAIELGGYNLGYYVGKSKTPADDIAIADAYKLAMGQQLTPAEIAQAFNQLKIDNPQLAGSLVIILKNMGATFDQPGGNLIGLTGIPTEYWTAAKNGYVLGYES